MTYVWRGCLAVRGRGGTCVRGAGVLQGALAWPGQGEAAVGVEGVV